MQTVDIGEAEYQSFAKALRDVSFFANLGVTQLDLIMRFVRLYEVKSGEFVFQQGDPGDALFVVQHGLLSVYTRAFFLAPKKSLGLLRPGAVFGEMALLDRKPRSATVRALVSSRVFALLASDFDDVVETNLSFAKHIRRVASQRLFENRRAA